MFQEDTLEKLTDLVIKYKEQNMYVEILVEPL